MLEKTEMTPYEKVQAARKGGRPNIMEYIDALFDDFFEMHGDRLYRDDTSIVGGIARFHGEPVTVIGHRKGRALQENLKFNFGMASPEGYRKGVRLMQQAEKFGRPIITFIDTPGAYPGVEAENNGQSNAIAESIAFMSQLKVPTIAVITGEGSSGGALALAVSDRVWMMENAVYSILSPEGFASILWKDAKLAPKACEIMKITAQELKAYGLIDTIVPEGNRMFHVLDKMLRAELAELKKKPVEELVEERYRKFRKIDRKNVG